MFSKQSFIIGALMLCVTGASHALVNPQLQPTHLIERHEAVIAGVVTTADYGSGKVVFLITDICKGRFEPNHVSVDVPEVDFDEASLFDDVEEGGTIVAYVGKRRRRHERDVLLYAGSRWHEAQMKSLHDKSHWDWAAALGDEMVGTFNGDAGRLRDMMLDAAEGLDFFPARPTIKFKDSVAIGKFSAPIRAVAIFDIDRDGRPDLFAANRQESRIYLQSGDLEFSNPANRPDMGVPGCVSCSFVDLNADGYPELLADDIVYKGSSGGFVRSDMLPGSPSGKVVSSAFVEINGDGRPDAAVSYEKGGMRVFLNTGSNSPVFEDATASIGLEKEKNGAGLSGFFAPGDFNGDRRCDLYYGAGNGFILLQDGNGRFAPMQHKLPFDYATFSASDESALTGAGCFAPIWKVDSQDLIVPAEMHFILAVYEQGKARNVTGCGNEIRLGRVSQIATLAEDLNVDGYLDLLTITRAADAENIFHANRGYGSFMLSELYMDYEGLPGEGFGKGAWSVAAGDLNDDGAPDLLLGGADGTLRLALNDVFRHPLRQPKEHPTALQAALAKIKVLTVQTDRPGVEITVTDSKGRTVARRITGASVLTGCCGPYTVDFAVRSDGKCTLATRTGERPEVSRIINLNRKERVKVRLDWK